jgi:hypothetical protein
MNYCKDCKYFIDATSPLDSYYKHYCGKHPFMNYVTKDTYYATCDMIRKSNNSHCDEFEPKPLKVKWYKKLIQKIKTKQI